MIKKAKVSALAVRTFANAVSKVMEYSERFDEGISCLEELLRYLSEQNEDLSSSIEKMESANDSLSKVINKIEETISGIMYEIDELENELSHLRDELSDTPRTITVTDWEGRKHKERNSDYDYLKERIRGVREEISDLEDSLYDEKQRLDRAERIERKLSIHIAEIHQVINSVKDMQRSIKTLISKIDDVKKGNTNNSDNANDGLKKALKAIYDYMKIKMEYDAGKQYIEKFTPRDTQDSVDENPNKGKEAKEQIYVENKDQENSIHKIKYDSQNHICEYDGRRYGGKYVLYEERKNGTSKSGPLSGYYEGERGESKFIPSDRTAKGLAVLEILRQKGLDGIVYRNAEPDFEVCSEAEVTIENMTENREDYRDINGNQMPGNFTQADIKLAEKWNSERRDNRTDWTGLDVEEYRKVNRLTWHEKCDTITMILVRCEINDFFSHYGGCAECRVRDGGSNEGGFDE